MTKPPTGGTLCIPALAGGLASVGHSTPPASNTKRPLIRYNMPGIGSHNLLLYLHVCMAYLMAVRHAVAVGGVSMLFSKEDNGRGARKMPVYRRW